MGVFPDAVCGMSGGCGADGGAHGSCKPRRPPLVAEVASALSMLSG